MGESDVYEYLLQQRLAKNHTYFSKAEIEKVLKEKGKTYVNAGKKLGSLYRYGIVEITHKGLMGILKHRIKTRGLRPYKFYYRLSDQEYMKYIHLENPEPNTVKWGIPIKKS